jgi:HK97 family phage prohead protease
MTLTVTTDERRHLSLGVAAVEIRADGEGDAPGERFAGYAAMFNTRTAIGNPLKWGFYEEIAPGAFARSINAGDQRMLIDHDSYYVVSRVSAKTLRLAEDARGLAVDADLDPTLSYVSDLKANIRNGNITGMSFGFYVNRDEWLEEEVETSDGQTATVEVRVLHEVKLVEVSAVTFPAYEQTQAELKSVASALVRRGDAAAIERRAAFRPELRDLLQVIGRDSGESTRGDETVDPGESTRRHVDQIDLAMRGYAARFGLKIPA